jgi:hypothetical protein
MTSYSFSLFLPPRAALARPVAFPDFPDRVLVFVLAGDLGALDDFAALARFGFFI